MNLSLDNIFIYVFNMRQVLGMDPLPVQQKVFRRDRSGRKRRRSGGEQADSESELLGIVSGDTIVTLDFVFIKVIVVKW